MKIGFSSNTYPVQRNILGACDDAAYVRARNGATMALRLARVGRKAGLFTGERWAENNLVNQFRPVLPVRADVLHLFNQVSFGWTPWVSTFETILPRQQCTLSPAGWPAAVARPEIQQALRNMAAPSCRGLIALSQCNLAMQRDFLSLVPREMAAAIEPKLHQLHPPQKPLVPDLADKPTGGPVRFAFVGASFHRKGGREILDVLGRLRREGLDLHLTIVSTIALDPYAAAETTTDLVEARATIRANTDWITHHERLPNDQVLQLIRDSHVGLLPTYADTYGFAALEFQAGGCPVITTDVRAMPEINNERIGWIINVPRNKHGEALFATATQRHALSAAITAGLERAMREIFADRGAVRRKGEAALQRIREQHDQRTYAQRLRAIYGV